MAGKKQFEGVRKIHFFERSEYEIFEANVENSSAMLRALIHRYLQDKRLIP